MIKSVEFREKRDKAWRRLELLLKKVQGFRGFKSLSPQDLEELGILYRMAASSLHVVRSISLDQSVNNYLESLVTRAFFVIYATAPKQAGLVGNFIKRQFPALIRKYLLYHFVAFLILSLGIVAGFWATLTDPGNYFAFVSEEYAQGRSPFSSRSELKEVLESGRDTGDAQKTFFSSFLFTHNTKIGFLTFTTGIALGIPTFFLLVMNGGIMGALGATYHIHNLDGPFWAWILPHGITEILAVILCAGSGFILALGILRPGEHGRIANLKLAAKDAGLTAMGTVLMFLVAGLIEGFFRQTSLPDMPRYAFALITLIFWILYITAGGRREK